VAELCRGFDPDTPVFQTDLARTRALWREAGLAEGTALSILLPSSNLEARAIAELFQANLAAVGIRLDIQLTDFATYVGMAYGDLPAEERPNLLPSFWSPDYNDGWSHLWPQLSCDAWTSGNIGHYCNARVEELLGRFDAWAICPHGPGDGCSCRKPLPGLLVESSRDLGIDLAQGRRYSWGYPACPDQSEHEKVWRLLRLEEVGMSLSDGYAVEPEQSTVAIVAHHPQAVYFGMKSGFVSKEKAPDELIAGTERGGELPPEDEPGDGTVEAEGEQRAADEVPA
jgi:hypothetical protein